MVQPTTGTGVYLAQNEPFDNKAVEVYFNGKESKQGLRLVLIKDQDGTTHLVRRKIGFIEGLLAKLGLTSTGFLSKFGLANANIKDVIAFCKQKNITDTKFNDVIAHYNRNHPFRKIHDTFQAVVITPKTDSPPPPAPPPTAKAPPAPPPPPPTAKAPPTIAPTAKEPPKATIQDAKKAILSSSESVEGDQFLQKMCQEKQAADLYRAFVDVSIDPGHHSPNVREHLLRLLESEPFRQMADTVGIQNRDVSWLVTRLVEFATTSVNQSKDEKLETRLLTCIDRYDVAARKIAFGQTIDLANRRLATKALLLREPDSELVTRFVNRDRYNHPYLYDYDALLSSQSPNLEKALPMLVKEVFKSYRSNRQDTLFSHMLATHRHILANAIHHIDQQTLLQMPAKDQDLWKLAGQSTEPKSIEALASLMAKRGAPGMAENIAAARVLISSGQVDFQAKAIPIILQAGKDSPLVTLLEHATTAAWEKVGKDWTKNLPVKEVLAVLKMQKPEAIVAFFNGIAPPNFTNYLDKRDAFNELFAHLTIPEVHFASLGKLSDEAWGLLLTHNLKWGDIVSQVKEPQDQAVIRVLVKLSKAIGFDFMKGFTEDIWKVLPRNEFSSPIALICAVVSNDFAAMPDIASKIKEQERRDFMGYHYAVGSPQIEKLINTLEGTSEAGSHIAAMLAYRLVMMNHRLDLLLQLPRRLIEQNVRDIVALCTSVEQLLQVPRDILLANTRYVRGDPLRLKLMQKLPPQDAYRALSSWEEGAASVPEGSTWSLTNQPGFPFIQMLEVSQNPKHLDGLMSACAQQLYNTEFLNSVMTVFEKEPWKLWTVMTTNTLYEPIKDLAELDQFPKCQEILEFCFRNARLFTFGPESIPRLINTIQEAYRNKQLDRLLEAFDKATTNQKEYSLAAIRGASVEALANCLSYFPFEQLFLALFDPEARLKIQQAVTSGQCSFSDVNALRVLIDVGIKAPPNISEKILKSVRSFEDEIITTVSASNPLCPLHKMYNQERFSDRVIKIGKTTMNAHSALLQLDNYFKTLQVAEDGRTLQVPPDREKEANLRLMRLYGVFDPLSVEGQEILRTFKNEPCKLETLFNNPQALPDVELDMGGEKLPVHRVVLMTIPTFERLMTLGSEDTFSERKATTMPIKNYSYKQVHDVMQAIYSGHEPDVKDAAYVEAMDFFLNG